MNTSLNTQVGLNTPNISTPAPSSGARDPKTTTTRQTLEPSDAPSTGAWDPKTTARQTLEPSDVPSSGARDPKTTTRQTLEPSDAPNTEAKGSDAAPTEDVSPPTENQPALDAPKKEASTVKNSPAEALKAGSITPPDAFNDSLATSKGPFPPPNVSSAGPAGPTADKPSEGLPGSTLASPNHKSVTARDKGTVGQAPVQELTPYQGNQHENGGTNGFHQDDDQQQYIDNWSTNSVIDRGLQIPSRFQTIALGFRFPPILNDAGISKNEFRTFTKELKGLVALSKTQWLHCACCTYCVGVWCLPFAMLLGPVGLAPASAFGYKMAQRKRRRNLAAAQDSGQVEQVVIRWNKTFFKKRGLVCRVDLPSQADDMVDMDIAGSRLYKYQTKSGDVSTVPGTANSANPGDRRKQKKLRKLERKDSRFRQKSAQRMRIILAPINGPHDMSHRCDALTQGNGELNGSQAIGGNIGPHGGEVGIDAKFNAGRQSR